MVAATGAVARRPLRSFAGVQSRTGAPDHQPQQFWVLPRCPPPWMPFQEASLPGGGDREAAKGPHWAGGARGGIESRCRGPGTPVRAGLNSQAPHSEGGWERGPAGWAWSPAPRNWERDASRATWKPLAYGSLGGKTQQGTGDRPESLLPGLCELLLNGSSLYPGMAREGKCDRSLLQMGKWRLGEVNL